MLVQCPKCNTKYKVSDEVVKGATPAFRCSRCKHTFELGLEMPELSEPLATEDHAADRIATDTNKGQELSFTFPPQENEQFREQKTFADPAAKDSTHPSVGGEINDRWSITAGEVKEEELFTISGTREPAQEQEVTASSERPSLEKPLYDGSSSPVPEAPGNVYPIEPYRDQRASTVPFLTLFGLFIIFFSFAAAYHEVHPQISEDIVGKIPVLGSSVLKNNHLKKGVLLQSLQAGYHTILGSREVFVVTGVALNQNPVVIREVRVAGQLYNQDGKEIEQQTIWIGNAISPKIVRGMTVQDISDLQRLKPLKTFEIPPGDSVPFTIVFLKPTKAARDFSCEIISAESEA